MNIIAKKDLAIISTVLMLFAGIATAQAGEITAENLGKVTVSMPDAINKAKSAHAGTPIEAELENEDGHLLYEIKLLNGSTKTKVKIDATTGEVIKLK
jgi:uncharacterized membrane protein YkoI